MQQQQQQRQSAEYKMNPANTNITSVTAPANTLGPQAASTGIIIAENDESGGKMSENCQYLLAKLAKSAICGQNPQTKLKLNIQ